MRTHISFIFIAVIATVIIVGCNKSSPITSEATPTPQLTILPSDASSSIDITTNIALTFSKPVNRTVVTQNIFLINERNIPDSLYSMPSMMGHGTMMDIMADSSKMHYLDHYRSTHGTFTWNSDSTLCTFHPDSLLTPNTQYMVHLRSEMVQMMDQRLGNIGMMGNRGTGMMSGEMMFHFTTK